METYAPVFRVKTDDELRSIIMKSKENGCHVRYVNFSVLAFCPVQQILFVNKLCDICIEFCFVYVIYGFTSINNTNSLMIPLCINTCHLNLLYLVLMFGFWSPKDDGRNT